MKLLHGTSARFRKDIEKEGLKSPHLTNKPEIAEFFAKEAAAASGGDPIIVRVKVKDTKKLKVDEGMWRDTPWIVWDLHGLNDEGEFRQKLDSGNLPTPRTHDDFRASLKSVFAASYEGVLMPADITGIEDVEVFEDD